MMMIDDVSAAHEAKAWCRVERLEILCWPVDLARDRADLRQVLGKHLRLDLRGVELTSVLMLQPPVRQTDRQHVMALLLLSTNCAGADVEARLASELW